MRRKTQRLAGRANQADPTHSRGYRASGLDTPANTLADRTAAGPRARSRHHPSQPTEQQASRGASAGTPA